MNSLVFQIKMFVFCCFFIFSCGWNDGKEEELRNVIDDINNNLKTVGISEINSVFDSNVKPKKSLLIVQNYEIQEEVLFNINEYYVLSGGLSAHSNYSTLRKINQLIDSIYARKDNVYFDYFKNIEVSFTPFKYLGLEINTNLEILTELLYSIRKIVEVKYNRVDFYIKGFADGCKTSCKELGELHEDYNNYLYKSIPVHQALGDKNNPFFYSTEKTYKSIPNVYDNEHLPNLRSRFIEQSFITPFISINMGRWGISKENINVSILDGYDFEQIDSTLRKVEIYINLY